MQQNIGHKPLIDYTQIFLRHFNVSINKLYAYWDFGIRIIYTRYHWI